MELLEGVLPGALVCSAPPPLLGAAAESRRLRQYESFDAQGQWVRLADPDASSYEGVCVR